MKSFPYILVCIFALSLSEYANASFAQTDKQAHIVVGFQSVFLLSRALYKKGTVKEDAILLANAIAVTAALAKEALVDPVFSSEDMGMGFIGATSASILAAALPADSYELEAEAGALQYSPEGADSSTPPSSSLVKAQTTIWFKKMIGLHQFSGGADNGAKDDSGKRLFYGAGLRFPLLPFIMNKKSWPLLSLWVGADYGRMMFAVDTLSVAYPKYKNVAFYSLGGRLHLSQAFHLAAESQYIPYGGIKIWGLGGSLGLNF